MEVLYSGSGRQGEAGRRPAFRYDGLPSVSLLSIPTPLCFLLRVRLSLQSHSLANDHVVRAVIVAKMGFAAPHTRVCQDHSSGLD
jgi:hypothetical protein